MKAHIGVDAGSGLVHTVTTTPANVGDVTEVDKLLHGQEKTVYADAGYQWAEKRDDNGAWIDYVWLNGRLIGRMAGNQAYAIHDDQVGRPEVGRIPAKTSCGWHRIWRSR